MFIFPGLNPNRTAEASRNKRNQKKNVKPALPRAYTSEIDQYGQISIDFDVPMMLPEVINGTYWDGLLELEIVPDDPNNSTYTGKFFKNQRRALKIKN